MVELARRSFITGLIAFGVTAPAIVRAASIMPVRQINPLCVDDIAALLSRRIDDAELVMRNNLMQTLYGDFAPAGELFGTVMNHDLNRVGDRCWSPVLRWPSRQTVASITYNG